MKWEDLKVYHTLPKENLGHAKKEIAKTISANLALYGFKLYGRKLIRLSEDLFHIIHLDTRGSWTGASYSLKTEISITSVFDKNGFIYDLTIPSRKYIQNIIPDIKNYYQITTEYLLFADYISRKLIEFIIPYFAQYQNSQDILNRVSEFAHIGFRTGTEDIILYCELCNHINNKSIEIIDDKLLLLNKFNAGIEEINKLENLKNNIKSQNWKDIDIVLQDNKQEIFKKLKLTN